MAEINNRVYQGQNVYTLIGRFITDEAPNSVISLKANVSTEKSEEGGVGFTWLAFDCEGKMPGIMRQQLVIPAKSASVDIELDGAQFFRQTCHKVWANSLSESLQPWRVNRLTLTAEG